MMRESLSANRPLWSKLFSNNTSGNRKIALACYCKPNAHCHRYLLRDFIIDWKSSEGEEILDMGVFIIKKEEGYPPPISQTLAKDRVPIPLRRIKEEAEASPFILSY